jgi:hypothetical protein
MFFLFLPTWWFTPVSKWVMICNQLKSTHLWWALGALIVLNLFVLVPTGLVYIGSAARKEEAIFEEFGHYWRVANKTGLLVPLGSWRKKTCCAFCHLQSQTTRNGISWLGLEVWTKTLVQTCRGLKGSTSLEKSLKEGTGPQLGEDLDLEDLRSQCFGCHSFARWPSGLHYPLAI